MIPAHFAGEIHGRHNLRNVENGFPRNQLFPNQNPVIPAVSFSDWIYNSIFSSIIGAKSEFPTPEYIVEILEILGRGPTRFKYVFSFIHISVNPEPISFSRAFDKLPGANRSGAASAVEVDRFFEKYPQ